MRSMRTPSGSTPLALIFSTSACTARMVGMLLSPRCISTMPWTMSSLSSWPAMPRRGRKPIFTSATSLMNTGAAWLGETSTFSICAGVWIRPTPRTMADCGPKSTVWPPTLTLLLLMASSTFCRFRPWARRRRLSTTTS